MMFKYSLCYSLLLLDSHNNLFVYCMHTLYNSVFFFQLFALIVSLIIKPLEKSGRTKVPKSKSRSLFLFINKNIPIG